VSVVAVLGTALTLAAYSASAASTATLTATAVHITDHAAYVEAVVDFSGPGLTPSQVRATDPNPSNGIGGMLVSYPQVASHVSLVTAHGLSVRVVEVPYGLSVGIGALPGAFKYLSYVLAESDELVIDVWKSTFAPSGDISRGQGGCLVLSRVNAAPGTVTASGSAGRLFENQFRVVLRDAFGAVLASRSVSAIGRWRVTLNYTAPQAQGGYFEAAASSAKDGALACLVQKALALPASNARANLKVVYRAYADVNGDGRLDLVTLDRTGASQGELTVALARGARLSITTPSDAVWLPGLVATGNVDGRAGEELFVDIAHVSTAESVAIYTDWRGRLVRAGALPAYGNDYGVLYGITCSAQGSRHLITDHSFYIKFGTRTWMRQDTVYAWQGPALKVFARGSARPIHGAPSPTMVGVQCGHLPRVTPASVRLSKAAVAPPVGGSVPAGAVPASVSFVSSSTAFVLGSAPCSHAPCTLVLRTLDRGRSWRRLSAPAEAISVPDGNGLWGLRFADARRGYAYGAGLWQTTDGGASWARMTVPGRTVLAFAFVWNRELVAATTTCRSIGCAQGVVVYHRPIGAGAWKRVVVTASRGSVVDIAVHGKVVWLLADYDLYLSKDGGLSFRSHSQPCRPPHGGIGIPYPGGITDDGTHTYLLCLGSGYTGGVEKSIYRISGTRSVWSQVGQPPSPGGPVGFAAGSDKAIVIAAVSGASWLYRSTDEGRRWRTVLTYGDGGAGWADLDFTSALDGAVIHAPAPLTNIGQLLITDDGGWTWHTTSFSGTSSASRGNVPQAPLPRRRGRWVEPAAVPP